MPLWCFQNRCGHLIGCWYHAGCKTATDMVLLCFFELMVGQMDASFRFFGTSAV